MIGLGNIKVQVHVYGQFGLTKMNRYSSYRGVNYTDTLFDTPNKTFSMPIQPIRSRSPLSHPLSKFPQYYYRILPMNTSIRNTDSFLQSLWPLWRNILSSCSLESSSPIGYTFIDVTLNHDTTNETFSIGKLRSYIFCHDWLILVIFLRIPMRTINHHTFVQNLCFRHRNSTRFN